MNWWDWCIMGVPALIVVGFMPGWVRERREIKALRRQDKALRSGIAAMEAKMGTRELNKQLSRVKDVRGIAAEELDRQKGRRKS